MAKSHKKNWVVPEGHTPTDFDRRILEMQEKGFVVPTNSLIKTAEDIEGIRRAGVINTGLLDLIASEIKEGMSTEAIDRLVAEYTADHDAVCAPYGYEGFPKHCCTSINEVVCHGIPSEEEILFDGDIINVDSTVIVDGYYADASRMYLIGKVPAAAERLVKVTKECMERGIAAARPWHFLGDVSAACGDWAHANGYSVVTALGGHGVGKDFHMEPYVPHEGEPGTGMLMVPGMVFTVEPMINAGDYDVTVDCTDGWTVRTKDGTLSAQWEKTILITETGAEVLSS